MSLDIHLSMDESTLAPFRDAWADVANDDSGRRAVDLALAARMHYDGLPQPAVPGFIRRHIDLIPEIAELLSDQDWELDGDARRGLAGALAYFNDPRDLIPDANPRFGLLDDAIVIELALTENRAEWLAWQEYSALRREHRSLGPMNAIRWRELRAVLPRLLAPRPDSYIDSRFGRRDGRTRYRMLADLPRIDMH